MTEPGRTTDPPSKPIRIGPYRLARRLGQGGMGEVFLAWDERLGRRVALKRIRREAPTIEERERLRREASAAARLSHPAVVRIYDLVEDAAGDALVFEYVEGRTLRELLQEGLPSPALAARLGREIAEGLAAAHATGLVYRDLKAENVMVTPDRACIRVSTPGCGRWDTAKKTFSRIRGAATGCRTPGTDPALSQTARGN